MLTFNRPNFKSGTMVVKVTVGEVEAAFILRAADKGTTKAYPYEGLVTADVEAALVTKYPAFFEVPA